MRSGVLWLLVLLLLGLAPEAAAELGHYRPGQNDLRSTFLPRRGIHFSGGSHGFTSRTLIGDDGGRLDEVTIRLPFRTGREFTLDLDVRLDAATFIGTAAFVPLDLEQIGFRFGAAISGRATQGSADTGLFLIRSVGETDLRLGDPQVTPVWVGWRWSRVRLSASYSAWLPTGDYDPQDVVNPGHGYWTQQVQATLGLFYDPEHFGGLIFRTTYEVHHGATDGRVYLPGDTLTFEYGWSQDLVRYQGMAFGVGISGSSRLQVSANRVSRSKLGNLFGDGLLGRLLAERTRRALRARRSYTHALGGELTVRDVAGISVALVGSCDYDLQAGLQGYRVGVNVTIQLGVFRKRTPRK